MDADTYKFENVKAAMIANTLEAMPLAELREAQERTETLTPLTDPTLWMQKHDAFRIDCERTRILHEAQRKLKELRAKYEQRV